MDLTQESSWPPIQAAIAKTLTAGEGQDSALLKSQQEIQAGLLYAILISDPDTVSPKFLDLVGIIQKDRYSTLSDLFQCVFTSLQPGFAIC